MDGEPEEERERVLALLRDAHRFPGPFQFRVVVHPGREGDVVSAMAAALTRPTEPELSTRPSRNGRFLSLRATLVVASAEEVLEVYAILKRVEGVVTAL